MTCLHFEQPTMEITVTRWPDLSLFERDSSKNSIKNYLKKCIIKQLIKRETRTENE